LGTSEAPRNPALQLLEFVFPYLQHTHRHCGPPPAIALPGKNSLSQQEVRL
jgi:hypothetical protein